MWLAAVGSTAGLVIDWRPERAGKKGGIDGANAADAADASLAIWRTARKGDPAGAE
ncbi:MAG: hypothetical protein WBW81_06790 [Methylocella sp.]